MEEKINWFIELLNSNAKYGKYYFAYYERPLVSGYKTIEVLYEAHCWYEDIRDNNKTKVNRVITKWEGLRTIDNKEKFLENFLNDLFKTTIFIRDVEDIPDFNGCSHVYRSTTTLLTKGFNFNSI